MKEKKEYYADCYVLSEKRSAAFIYSFLDKFLPHRKEDADEYEVPQYADKPEIVLKTAVELIDYLTLNHEEIYSIYWSNAENAEIKGVMCFFTNNGHLILGIYCDTMFPDTTIEDNVFEDLKKFCGNSDGYVTYEEPATQDTNEFIERVKRMKA